MSTAGIGGGSSLGGSSAKGSSSSLRSVSSNSSSRGGVLDRIALRETIRENDFLDDNVTLLPQSLRPSHKAKPTRALTEAIEFRRKFNETRRAQMVTDNQRNMEITQSLHPDAVLARTRKQHDDKDEEELVGAFQRGEHWIRNPAKEQAADTTRETTFHLESAKILQDSEELQKDFQDHHIGEVTLPTETPKQVASRVYQEEYIERINNRMELFENYKFFTAEVLRLNMDVSMQESEMMVTEEELRGGMQSHGFEWQSKRNAKIMTLKAKTEVDKEDLAFSQRRLTSLRDEIARKFPEMSSGLNSDPSATSADGIDDSTTGDGTTVATERNATNAFAEGAIPVYCWLVGRLTFDGKICNMLFGQFSRDTEPPKRDWVFVGKNVDRNLVATSGGNGSVQAALRMKQGADGTYMSPEEEAEEAEMASAAAEGGGGLTSQAQKDHVINDFDLLLAQQDEILVTKCTNEDESYKALVEGSKPKDTIYYNIEGCSLKVINGRYLDDGKACNVRKYRNTRGWVIFRCALMEIPDLGIFADNCYVATTKNTGVAEALDRRAEYAFADIVNRSYMGAPDGSVQFKRRFAEMARSGQRVINVDQTMQLIRNENLKAEARSESDRALMMILTAVMGGKSHKGAEEAEGADGGGGSAEAAAAAAAAVLLEGQHEQKGAEESKAAGTTGVGTTAWGVGGGGGAQAPFNTAGPTTAGKGRGKGKKAPSSMRAGSSLSPIRESKQQDTEQTPVVGLGGGATTAAAATGDDEDVFGETSQDELGENGQSSDPDEIEDSDAADGASLASSINGDDDGDGESRISLASSHTGSTVSFAGIKKRTNYRKDKKKKRHGSSAGSSVASKSDSIQGDASVTAALNKLETGVDLDIKITLSKGIHYQVGSQGFPLARRGTFLQEESELSARVTKTIEARELAIFDLQIAAQKLTQDYLSSEGRLQDLDIDSMMTELMSQMRVVREATIKVAETYGAWARLCHLEKKTQQATAANPEDSDRAKAKAKRTYCVAIAVRGPEIYKASTEMKSTVSAKFGRSSEKAKYATDIKYVGEFATRDEAAAAFSSAISSIEPHLMLPEDSDGNKLLVGLRGCTKHYLARSSSVPQDLPCEACKAAELARPSLVVSRPYKNPEEELQQFIWHGKNYLQKMWTDLDFLNQNFLLKHIFPDFTVEYNPLLLTVGDYASVLSSSSDQKGGDALSFLRGRLEQVRDAQAAGTFSKKFYHGYELKALPFSETWSGNVNIEKAKLLYEKQLEAEKVAFLNGHVTDPKVIEEVTLRMNAVIAEENAKEIRCGRKPKHKALVAVKGVYTPWSEMSPASALNADTLGRSMPFVIGTLQRPSSENGLLGGGGDMQIEQVQIQLDPSFAATEPAGGKARDKGAKALSGSSGGVVGTIGADGFHSTLVSATSNKMSSGSATTMALSGTGTAAISGKYADTRGPADFSKSVSFANTSSNPNMSRYTVQRWLEEDPLDFVSKSRLNRAFFILGQSTTLTKQHLPPASLPQELKMSVLEKHGLKHSEDRSIAAATVGADGVNKTKVKGSIQGAVVEQGDDKFKTVDTEVSYYYHGAQFAMPQMRVPFTGRVEDVFVNYDSGEWQGIAKGRSIRSWEFNEKVLKEGREKNERRQRLSKQIRACLEVDVVRTDVDRIDDLIAQSKELRGSILQLDIIQAETFLKWRRACVRSIGKMQAMSRGNVGRKKALKRKKFLLEARRRAAEVVKQSIAASRTLVPDWISQAKSAATKHFCSIKFSYSLNMSGQLMVLRVTPWSRHAKRSPDLCPTCVVNARSSRSKNATKRNNKATVSVSRRAPQAFFQNGSMEYQSPAGPHTERAMCTCQWIHMTEQWCITLFEPLTGRSVRQIFSMHDVRKLIEGIEAGSKLMQRDLRLQSLVGKSWAPIGPVFEPSDVAFSGRMDMSYSNARLRAAEEGSQLPLLPKYPGLWLNDEVMDAIKSRQPGSLAVDRLRGSAYSLSKSTKVMNDIDNLELASDESWNFEPMADILYSQRHIQRIQHHETTLVKRIAAAKQNVKTARRAYERFIVNELEKYPMCFEDTRSRFIRTDESLQVAIARIEAVMRFSRNNIETLELQEKNIAEDWGQDYDSLEDGSAWQGLNSRRRLEKQWKVDCEEYHKYFAMIPGLLPTQVQLRQSIHKAADHLSRCLAEQADYAPTLAIAKDVQKEVIQIAKNVIRATVGSFTMPRKLRSPVKRRFEPKQRHLELVFMRDPKIRALPKYLGCWQLLERRAITLRSNENVTTSGKMALRCVTEIHLDPLTKWVLIRMLQDEVPTEESSMHLDMEIPREQLSDLTSATLGTDILLRPQDVQDILSRSPNWPAVRKEEEGASSQQIRRKYKSNNVFLIEQWRAERQAIIDAEEAAKQKIIADKAEKKRLALQADEDLRLAAQKQAASGRQHKGLALVGPGRKGPGGPGQGQALASRNGMSSRGATPTSRGGVRSPQRVGTAGRTDKAPIPQDQFTDDSAPATATATAASSRSPSRNSVRMASPPPSAKTGSRALNAASSGAAAGAAAVGGGSKPSTPAPSLDQNRAGSSNSPSRQSVRQAAPPTPKAKGKATTPGTGTSKRENKANAQKAAGDADADVDVLDIDIGLGASSDSCDSAGEGEGEGSVGSVGSAMSRKSIESAHLVTLGQMMLMASDDGSSLDGGGSSVGSQDNDEQSVVSQGLSVESLQSVVEDSQRPAGGAAAAVAPDADGNSVDGDSADGKSAIHGENSILSVESSVSSYTPRRTRLPLIESGWIPPSKRLRSLKGIKIWASNDSNENEMGRTYGKRRTEKENRERNMARALMSYLRLQPYTGRPCLGLVHMSRKVEYVSKIVAGCIWYRDLARGKPSMWVNEVSSEWRYSGTRFVHTKLRACLDGFELQVRLTSGNVVSLLIPFADVVRNIAVNRPSLLAAFLCETIINRFSKDTHNHIVDFVDYMLPGWGNGMGMKLQSFRIEFYGEVPRLRFLQRREDSFRGPINRCHRFIAGKYFEIVFSMNANDDLRLEFNSPTDGNFSGHKYWGDPITADLPRDVLRAFLAKLCVLPEVCPKEYLGSLNYLHPDYWIDFLPVLLDFITVDIEHAMRLTRKRNSNEKYADRINAAIGKLLPPEYEVIPGSKLEKQINEMQYLFEKFNHWTRRTQGMVQSLSPAVQEISKTALWKSQMPMPWQLRLRKDKASASLVVVRQEIWTTKDPSRYVWDCETKAHLAQRSHDLSQVKGLSGRALLRTIKEKYEKSQFLYGDTIGDDLESHWDVQFLSDEHKNTFYVDIKPADISCNGVQEAFAAKEILLMAQEDTESRIALTFERRRTLLAESIRKLDRAQQKLESSFARKLALSQASINKQVSEATQARERVLRYIDTWLNLRCEMIYNTAISGSLTLVMNKAEKKAQKKDFKSKKFGGYYSEFLSVSDVAYFDYQRLQMSKYPLHPSAKRITSPSPNLNPIATAQDAVPGGLNAMNCKVVRTQNAPNHLLTQVLKAFSDICADVVNANADMLPPKIDHNAATVNSQKLNVAIVMSSTHRKGTVGKNGGANTFTRTSQMPNNTHALSFDTAVMPRYDAYAGTLTGFDKLAYKYRDPTLWGRLKRPTNPTGVAFIDKDSLLTSAEDSHRRSQVSTNPHASKKVVRINGRVYLATQPAFGPADIVTFSIYDAARSVSWSVSLSSKEIKYPYLHDCIMHGRGAAPVTAAVDDDEEREEEGEAVTPGDAKADFAAAASKGKSKGKSAGKSKNKASAEGDEDEEKGKGKDGQPELAGEVSKKHLIRTIAERFVWKTFVHGMSSVLVKSVSNHLNQENAELEDAVCNAIHKIEGYRDQVKRLTEAQAEDAYRYANRKFKISAGLPVEEWKFGDALDVIAMGREGSKPSAAVRSTEATLDTRLVITKADLAPPSSAALSDAHIPPPPLPLYREVPYAPNIRLTGVLIPFDEALPGLPFAVNNRDFSGVLRHFYPNGHDFDSLKRFFTLSSIIFSPEHDKGAKRGDASTGRWQPMNPRVTRWIDEYSNNRGWREGARKQRMRHLAKVEKRLFDDVADRQANENEKDSSTGGSQAADADDSSAFIGPRGNTLVVLRYEQDVSLIRDWLQARYDEYAPMRELRRLKEGREKEFRIENHKKFREKVFGMSEYFLKGAERLFKLDKSINTDTEELQVIAERKRGSGTGCCPLSDISASTFQVRVLLSRYLELREDAEKASVSINAASAAASGQQTGPQRSVYDSVSHLTTMDEAFLLDTDVAHVTDDQLLRFDTMPNDAVYEDAQFVLDWATRRVGMYGVVLEGTREDLAPRAGQIVYAMYLLHCTECVVATNICPFPGCGCIRLQAAAAVQEALLLESVHGSGSESSSAAVSLSEREFPLEIMSADAVAAVNTPLLDAFSGHLMQLKGSGKHPLERAVRRYLLNGRALANSMLPVYCGPVVGVSPALEIKNEEATDQQEVKRLEEIEYMRVNWKALLHESHYLRYISRRFSHPSVYGILSSDDILEARGGINNSNDEQALDSDNSRNALEHVPSPMDLAEKVEEDVDAAPIAAAAAAGTNAGGNDHDLVRVGSKDHNQGGGGAKKTKNNNNSSSAAADVANKAKDELSYIGELIEIPKTKLLEILGGCGVDGRGNRVPVWAVDPYPAQQSPQLMLENGQSEKSPMTRSMFDWLSKRLILSRPKRLVYPASGDRGQFCEFPIMLKIDRMQCEGTSVLMDGSLVYLQILQGMLDDVPLSNDDISGTPPAAIRFCPIRMIHRLVKGLTLVLFDSLSGRTRAIAIDGRALFRTAEAFAIPEANTPAIANAILSKAMHVIRLNRVGKDCTGFTLDINGITNHVNPSQEKEKGKALEAVGSRSGSLLDVRHSALGKQDAAAASAAVVKTAMAGIPVSKRSYRGRRQVVVCESAMRRAQLAQAILLTRQLKLQVESNTRKLIQQQQQQQSPSSSSLPSSSIDGARGTGGVQRPCKIYSPSFDEDEDY